MTTAQTTSQPKTVSQDRPSRVNSVFLGVSGGMPIYHYISNRNSYFTGYSGQAEAFVFVTENITVGANYTYNFFPGSDTLYRFAMDEVLISGAYHFKSSWNPHISVGFGYYGELGESHFGLTPGIGIMPKIANRVYFKARGSVAFFNIGGQLFKFEAGFTFMVFQHKPVKR